MVWLLCPSAISAVSLTGMVHNHQDGQAYLQVVKIIKSFHWLQKYKEFLISPNIRDI